MKTYIDCGAYDGDSVKAFLNNHQPFKRRTDARYYNIIAIEPNAESYQQQWNELFNIVPRLALINAVAWVEFGTIPFKRYPNCLSSCVAKFPMQSHDDNTHELVDLPCFDLVQFIIDLRERGTDYLVLKLDIESSEYTILPKLLKEAAYCLDELYVEYHYTIPNWQLQKASIERQIGELAPLCYYRTW